MISIFTPTFNRAELLSVLKNSIDAQVCTDFEWIIVDDGSTDDTKKLATAWMEQKLPYRLKYIWQENQGKQSAFNTAVKEAIGEWFICVDSDDHLTENAVNIMNIDINSINTKCFEPACIICGIMGVLLVSRYGIGKRYIYISMLMTPVMLAGALYTKYESKIKNGKWLLIPTVLCLTTVCLSGGGTSRTIKGPDIKWVAFLSGDFLWHCFLHID